MTEYEIRNKSDLTPNNIANAMFNMTADPFGTMADLKRVAGQVNGMEIIDLKQEFSTEYSRGKLSREEAIDGFTKKLEEHASELDLKM